MSNPIYLDHHSTTPLDKRVLAAMMPYFCEIFGNAASTDHLHGLKAKKAVQEARKAIADMLGCRKENEIIFTSGATESNNLALMGIFRKFRSKGNHIISSVIEHPSILDTLEHLKSEGADVTLVPVDRYGTIDLEFLQNAIRKETILISIMFANNEIGTIQPIKKIGQLAKDNSIIFHTDAAQAAGHIKIDVYDLNIDLLSFSAHKFYGPKGIGGVFVRSFAPHIKLNPILFGGGQERGMRSGTLNVPSIVGMCEALSIATKESNTENIRLRKLSNKIFSYLKENFPNIMLNGHPENKLAHNISILLPGVESKALIHLLKDKISFSASSACSTTKVEPSYVLKAIGLSDVETYHTIRLGLGRDTEDYGIEKIISDGIKQLIGCA